MNQLGKLSILLLGLAFNFNCFAATVTFETSGLLKIPSVQVGSIFYNVELNLLNNVSPITFELGSNISQTHDSPDANYQNNVLSIPDVAYGQDRYSAELALVPDSSPLRFQLSSASLNCSDCVDNNSANSVSGLTFNFNESTPGYGETNGTIKFNQDGTFYDDAINNNGHFISTGTWSQTGSELSIHFTFYQYDGQEGVNYDGITLSGLLQNNLGSLTDGNTTMNFTSVVSD